LSLLLLSFSFTLAQPFPFLSRQAASLAPPCLPYSPTHSPPSSLLPSSPALIFLQWNLKQVPADLAEFSLLIANSLISYKNHYFSLPVDLFTVFGNTDPKKDFPFLDVPTFTMAEVATILGQVVEAVLKRKDLLPRYLFFSG
jgi:hypothetical protein